MKIRIAPPPPSQKKKERKITMHVTKKPKTIQILICESCIVATYSFKISKMFFITEKLFRMEFLKFLTA